MRTGFGAYASVGFSYGGAGGNAGGDGSEGSSSEESESEEEGVEPSITQEGLDRLAQVVGIDNFSVLLRKAEKEERDLELGLIKRPK